MSNWWPKRYFPRILGGVTPVMVQFNDGPWVTHRDFERLLDKHARSLFPNETKKENIDEIKNIVLEHLKNEVEDELAR